MTSTVITYDETNSDQTDALAALVYAGATNVGAGIVDSGGVFNNTGILYGSTWYANGIFDGTDGTDGTRYATGIFDGATVNDLTHADVFSGGTIDIAALESAAADAQLATDQGEVTAAVASINDDITLLTITGTQNIATIQSDSFALGQADQLGTDQAAVLAVADSIKTDITDLLGQAGTLDMSLYALWQGAGIYADTTTHYFYGIYTDGFGGYFPQGILDTYYGQHDTGIIDANGEYHASGVWGNHAVYGVDWEQYGVVDNDGNRYDAGILDALHAWHDHGILNPAYGFDGTQGIVDSDGLMSDEGILDYYGVWSGYGILEPDGTYSATGMYDGSTVTPTYDWTLLSGLTFPAVENVKTTETGWGPDGTGYGPGQLDMSLYTLLTDINWPLPEQTVLTGTPYWGIAGALNDGTLASVILEADGTPHTTGIFDGSTWYATGVYDYNGLRREYGIMGSNAPNSFAAGILVGESGSNIYWPTGIFDGSTYTATGIFDGMVWYPNGIFDGTNGLDGTRYLGGIFDGTLYYSTGIFDGSTWYATGVYDYNGLRREYGIMGSNAPNSFAAGILVGESGSNIYYPTGIFDGLNLYNNGIFDGTGQDDGTRYANGIWDGSARFEGGILSGGLYYSVRLGESGSGEISYTFV